MPGFCPYFGFLPFPTFSLSFGTVRSLSAPRRSPVDFVSDFLSLCVFPNGTFFFLYPRISAVSVYFIFFSRYFVFFSREKGIRCRHIMRIFRRRFQVMAAPLSRAAPVCALVPNRKFRAFFAECALRIPGLLLILRGRRCVNDCGIRNCSLSSGFFLPSEACSVPQQISVPADDSFPGQDGNVPKSLRSFFQVFALP